jgi:Tol biopolymer transport system component/DNA-binding winged helix-turn-helix (wHTH) protein
MADTETKTAYAFGPYLLLPEIRRLGGANGQVVMLRGKGFELLWYLIRNSGRLVEKDELMEAIWPGTVVEENNLSQTVSALRHALGDDTRNPQYIATIKGRGYQFVGDARRVDTLADADQATGPGNPLAVPAVVITVALVVSAAVVWLARSGEQVLPETGITERFSDARVELLTNYAGSHSEPALSPGGQMIAYTSDAGGAPQIWIRTLTGGEPARITTGPYSAGSPTWSADDRLLYTRSGPNGLSVFSVDMLGISEPRLVVRSAKEPHHATHADAFVYTTGLRIWLARNDGRDRREISGVPVSQGFADREPALSPDGTRVAFIHADEGPLGNLWLIPSAGGDARQLTTPATGSGIASSPAWSADGRFIVYSVNAGASRSQLWRVDVDSGAAKPLTVGPGGAYQPALSSDGVRMTYTAAHPRWLLTRIDPVTREADTLFESRTRIVLPVASPDRRSIVFFTQIATGMQLFTLDGDGGNLQQRTFDDPGENALPTWDSDGDSILYYRGRSLYRLNLADGSDAQVLEDFHWSSRNWLDTFRNRMTFHKVDRTTGERHTVIRSFEASDEIELPVPVEAAQWSPDGEELLGFYRGTGDLMICRADASGCRSIKHDGAPLRGWRPMWSRDGTQIYYVRLTPDSDLWTLWRVERDGTNSAELADLPGFEADNSHIDFTEDGAVFYNHRDDRANEIWLATADERL